MNKLIGFLFLIVLLLPVYVLSQSLKDKIKDISSIREANKFIMTNVSAEAELITIIPNSDSSDIQKLIQDKTKGDIIESGGYIYKLLDEKKGVFSRVSYIYLDGSQLSIKVIDSLRKRVISMHNEGEAFKTLASMYNMDGNKDGDTGWFTDGTMENEFEKATEEKNLNEIFTVDVDSKQMYFVVKKTYLRNKGKLLTILKSKIE